LPPRSDDRLRRLCRAAFGRVRLHRVSVVRGALLVLGFLSRGFVRGGFRRPLGRLGVGRFLRFLERVQSFRLPFQSRLFDLPVLDFLLPSIHQPLALETPVEEGALADVGFQGGDAIGLARDRLGGERGGQRADVDLPLRRLQRIVDGHPRAWRRPGPELQIAGR